jgi:hypothetical protein
VDDPETGSLVLRAHQLRRDLSEKETETRLLFCRKAPRNIPFLTHARTVVENPLRADASCLRRRYECSAAPPAPTKILLLLPAALKAKRSRRPLLPRCRLRQPATPTHPNFTPACRRRRTASGRIAPAASSSRRSKKPGGWIRAHFSPAVSLVSRRLAGSICVRPRSGQFGNAILTKKVPSLAGLFVLIKSGGSLPRLRRAAVRWLPERERKVLAPRSLPDLTQPAANSHFF